MKDNMVSDEIAALIAKSEPIPNSNRLFIGPGEDGITLFTQQTRALNLLYALYESKRLPLTAKIAIVGGGAAGITAAAAAWTLGYEVYLLEKCTVYCHLQYGCDTRWI